MDDLAGLDFNAKSNGASQSRPAPNASTFTSSIPALRPSLASSALTPQISSRPNSALSGAGSIGSLSKAASPANDSFANLVSTASSKSKTSLSLQDRQNQLLQERQRQIQEQQQRHAKEAQLWNTLGAGSRPTPVDSTNGAKKEEEEDVEDILAAFNSSAKVDKSSHFPPPLSAQQSGRSTPGLAPLPVHSNGMDTGGFDDDDDPFGLGSMPAQRPSQSAKSPSPQSLSMDDDFLGELGKPVQPKQRITPSPPPARSPTPPQGELRAKANSTPLDRSIAELVDMGFPPDKARTALEETNGNLQTAVSWLLNQAHAESQQKAQGRSVERHSSPAKSKRPEQADQGSVPPWMRADSRSGSQQRRPDSAASNPDKDASQYASEVSTSFLKSANSLWKAGRKQVQKAVSEFQQQEGGDPSQPKWMRDASSDSQRSATPSQSRQPHLDHSAKSQVGPKHADMTNEAMLLESGGSRPTRPSKTTAKIPNEPSAPSPLRGRSPAQVLPERSAPASRFPQHPVPPPRQSTKLSREHVEEQAAQAYVSSARRRKPAVPKEPEPEVDLFSPAPAKPQPTPSSAYRPQNPSSRAGSTPVPARSKAPPRDVPSVSPAALSQSAQHRAKGTEAFKRGDYDSAHQSYTAALSPLPSAHPITIIILSNRSLTALKTGDPKLAIQDADKALALLGISRGEGETIDLGASEGHKEMKDFYGKALMRKAEALEAMEKWTDAGTAWRLVIEAGAGGLVAVRGRDRCAKAANPAPASRAVSAPPVAAAAAAARVSKPPAARPAPRKAQTGAGASQEAVAKLRAANAKEAAVDDEKFALADVVSAKIEGWRGGKSDNLRALLGSLEAVLWEGAGWKKVGMAELVLPNKVKVVYMKAIAKVHPDKIAQDATTEQRMISGSVFSTLNEAWDKFKTENGL